MRTNDMFVTNDTDVPLSWFLCREEWFCDHHVFPQRALNSFFEEDMKAVFDADQDANPRKEPPHTSKNEAGAVDW